MGASLSLLLMMILGTEWSRSSEKTRAKRQACFSDSDLHCERHGNDGLVGYTYTMMPNAFPV